MSLQEAVPCGLCGGLEVDETIESAAQLSRSDERFTFVRCASCQLVRLSPRPALADLARWYDDYLLHGDARAWGRYAPLVERSFEAQDRARVRVALRARPLSPEMKALDVGCGRPTYLSRLARLTGASATGVDLSDAGWRSETARFEGLELHATPVADAPLTGPFDLITAWHALEHDPAPIEALRRLRSVARADARLIVEVPDAGGLTRRLQGSRWAGFHTPRHLHVFDPSTLRAVLEAAGWKVETQYRRGTLDPWVLYWLGRVGSERTAINLEARFLPFVLGKVATLPLVALQRLIPLGVQTAIARPA